MPSSTSAAVRRLLGALLFLSINAHAALPGSGDVPPDYLGKTTDGTTIKVSDYTGKAVVVSFWATWCGYCLKELPVLNAIQKTGKDRIKVIAVNTEDKFTFRDASRTLARSYAIGLTNDFDKVASTAYGVTGIPHMLIIGKDGKIVRVYRGYDEKSLPQIVADINEAVGAAAATKE
jgi:thiol-disulfide isomerase/thioredoxin